MEFSYNKQYLPLPIISDNYIKPHQDLQIPPQMPDLVQSNLTELLVSLQNTVVKQHMLLNHILSNQPKPEKRPQRDLLTPARDQGNSIVIRRQGPISPQKPIFSPIQQPFPPSYKLHRILDTPRENMVIRQEYCEKIREQDRPIAKKSFLGINIAVTRESSMDTDTSIDDSFQKCLLKKSELTRSLSLVREKSQSASEEGDLHPVPILRRNGFKSEIIGQARSDEEGGYEESQRKSNKLIIPKRPPSKAKHLWINYGRKILEFAVNNTKDEVQGRIKQLIGKLSSKKDFEDIFGVKPEDTEYEKTFKILLGKMAIYFVKMQAEAAFEGSKYRDQMITQKNVVAGLINRLINGQI